MTFAQGRNHLDGADALVYVRQRHALNGLLDATVRAVSVDDSLTNSGLRDLAVTVAGVRHSAVTYLNAPISGFGREGAQDVDYLDATRSMDLWAAFRNGTASEYAASYPSDKLAGTPLDRLPIANRAMVPDDLHSEGPPAPRSADSGEIP